MRKHICAVDHCVSDSSALKIQAEFGGDPFSLSSGNLSEDIKQFL